MDVRVGVSGWQYSYGLFLGVIAPALLNVLPALLFLRLPMLIGDIGTSYTLLAVLICGVNVLLGCLSQSAIVTSGVHHGMTSVYY